MQHATSPGHTWEQRLLVWPRVKSRRGLQETETGQERWWAAQGQQQEDLWLAKSPGQCLLRLRQLPPDQAVLL